jgi:hypothetical protein
MDMIHIPKVHGLRDEFRSRFRDTLFVCDPEDKAKVEDYLSSRGKSFEDMMNQKPDWVKRRVRRVVPPKEALYPDVKCLFDTFGPLRCAASGRRLFDAEAEQQARNVLAAINQGQVSDPPGVAFYFLVGYDKDGLPLYRCTRGTNSIEGGVHQNIIRKFGSFGASPELADCMLAEYRLRHNIDVSFVNFTCFEDVCFT